MSISGKNKKVMETFNFTKWFGRYVLEGYKSFPVGGFLVDVGAPLPTTTQSTRTNNHTSMASFTCNQLSLTNKIQSHKLYNHGSI